MSSNNIKEKISIARDRIKELEVLISAWESTLPKRKFGDKNDHVEPTITTPNGEISETLMSGALGQYYNKEDINVT
jgi:hypothetical protein|tara:strand:- start:582 stop:809 length:228 start_codon:yes stop_codon:yes gene_type:complete